MRTTKIRLFLIFLFLLPLPIMGQEEDIFPQYHSSFGVFPPGARSPGMGGTFIALAEDATATGPFLQNRKYPLTFDTPVSKTGPSSG